MSVDETDDLARRYESLPDDDLAALAASSYELTEAIMSAHPDMAQDAGFELFDARWARRYWRSLARELSGLDSAEKVKGWATSATITGVANLLVATFGIPAVALSSAVALAVIVVRAAHSNDTESGFADGQFDDD